MRIIKLFSVLLLIYTVGVCLLHKKLLPGVIDVEMTANEPILDGQRKCESHSVKNKSEINNSGPDYWKWSNMSGESMFDFDPLRSCHDLVWSPGSGKNDFITGIKKAAIALAVTKLEVNYIKNITNQIKNIRRVSDRDIIIIVLKSGRRNEGVIKKLYRCISGGNLTGIKVLERDLGFNESDLAKGFLDYQRTNRNCCGIAEYVKLEVFGLPYNEVLFLDMDARLIKSPEVLFQCNKDFLYTAGPLSPMNGGMFVVKPSKKLYRHMIETLKRVSHTYTNKLCYEGLGCGPCGCGLCNPNRKRECTGTEGPQGYLHYYFVKRQDCNLHVHQISSCLFNFQVNFANKLKKNICRKELLYSYPYIIHKDKYNILTNILNKKQSMILDTQVQKKCRPDFWILGTHRGGTSSLYTLIAQHNEVESPFRLHREPVGQVAEPLTNIEKYNKIFTDSTNETKLVGDSTSSRLIKDARAIVQTCGHKYTKFLILLRNPVHRCHSDMLKRARDDTSALTKNSNISQIVLNDLRNFQKATNNSSKWVKSLHPSDRVDELNCVNAGIYVAQLKRWLYHASITNFRIYFFEHFYTFQQEIVCDALQFIGVPHAKIRNFTISLHQENLNSRPQAKLLLHQQLMPALHKQLNDTFAPYNFMLKKFLHTELPW